MITATSSFAEIHSEFRPKLLRYLNGLVGPNDAEDVCQDVFVKAHAGLKDFRGEASLSTWMYRIATNAAIDRLRARSVGDAVGQASRDDAIVDPGSDETESSAESSIIRREMNHCISAFVGALPENYRVVLALSDLEGLNNQDIADALGLSLDAVKIRLHRARRELKKRLETGCELYRTEANELGCDEKPAAARSAA